MKQSKGLQFRILTNQPPTSCTVQLGTPHFAKCFTMPSLGQLYTEILANYEHVVNPKSIEFTLTSNRMEQARIDRFIDELSKKLGSIRVRRVHNKQMYRVDGYRAMLALLNFGASCGYRVIKKHQAGDEQQGTIVLFYFESKEAEIKALAAQISGFGEEVLAYCLTLKIESCQIGPQLVRGTFEQLLGRYHQQIQQVAMQSAIAVGNMGICRRAGPGSQQKQWFILLNLCGVLANLHSFYERLDYVISSIPLHLVPIDSIRYKKLDKLSHCLPYENGIAMITGEALLITDRSMSSKEVNGLKLGQFLLSQGTLSAMQIKVLDSENESERFRDYFQSRFSHFGISIAGEMVSLKCYQFQLQRAIQECRDFASQFVIEKVQLTQFSSKMVSNQFFQNHRHEFSERFKVNFSTDGDNMFRQNYKMDSEDIEAELIVKNQQIVSQLINVPSLAPICRFHSQLNSFQGLYEQETNPEGFSQKTFHSVKYKFSNKCDLILSQLPNLVNSQYQDTVVMVIHNELPLCSKIYSICSNNGVEVKKFQENLRIVRSCRVKKFPAKPCNNFKNIILLGVEMKQMNFRHYELDITNSLKEQAHLETINLVIGLEAKKLIKEVLLKMLEISHELIEANRLKCSRLCIYYEDASLLAEMQRTVKKCRFDVPLVTPRYWDAWSLLKMNNIRQFVLSYYCYDQTRTLPGIDSYLCYLKETEMPKLPHLVTIPTPEELEQGYHQYFVDFQESRVLQVVGSVTICQYGYEQMSQKFNRLIYMIERKVKGLKFFVAYAKNIDYQKASEICLNIYQAKNQKMVPLDFNLEAGKIGYNKAELIEYGIVKKNYLQWFKIRIPKKQLPLLQKCLYK